jgi:uncharacterized membrane protein SpoIIM required for sporulation/uncharacterized RDD family membrane protein YckC
LTLPLAGIGERAIASMVDALFIVLLLVTLLFTYNLVGKGDLERDVAQATTTMFLVIGGLTLAGIVLYDVVADVFFGGRTPGKRVAGLRVIDRHGRSPDLMTSLLRNLLRLVDLLPLGYGVGVATMFVTGTRRIGDLVAGTVVVNERGRRPQPVALAIAAAGDHTAAPTRALADDDVVGGFDLLARTAGLEAVLADRLCAPLVQSLTSTQQTHHARQTLAALLLTASTTQPLASRVWRLHDSERALRAALKNLAGGEGSPHTRAEHLDSVARQAASELMAASRRHVPKRFLEAVSLALLEVEEARRPLPPPLLQRLVSTFADDVPRAVYAERFTILRAAAVFVLAFVVGGALSFIDLEVARGLIGDDLMGLVEGGATWTDAIERDGAYLRTTVSVGFNNIVIGLRMFALGIASGLATLLALVLNGVSLGATFGAAFRLDTADTLLRFIVGHGPVELSMVCVAAAAGFVLGRGVVSPGQRSRVQALRQAGRQGLLLALFATTGFAAIATVEGFISPGAHFPLVVKVAVGVGSWALFAAWAARGRPPSQ